jgi:hypothetical protein
MPQDPKFTHTSDQLIAHYRAEGKQYAAMHQELTMAGIHPGEATKIVVAKTLAVNLSLLMRRMGNPFGGDAS